MDPAPNPVALSVSTPSESLPAIPGSTVKTWVRIGNNGSAALPVSITLATVTLGDNGSTSLSGSEDARFLGALTLDSAHATVAAGQFAEIPVTIKIPSTLAPDTYVLGLLVSPQASGTGTVRVSNQVGALISLSVPGQRDRRLAVDIRSATGFAITDSPTLKVRVRNIGRSAVEFTSESTIGGLAIRSPTDLRKPLALVPAARYRDIDVSWQAPLGIGLYEVHTRVTNHQSDATTVDHTASRTIFVIAPATLAALGGALVAASATAIVYWRRTTRARARRHGAPRRSAATRRH